MRAAEAGAVVCVVDGMKRHGDRADVQQQGCSALVNLSADSNNAELATSLGAIEAVLAAVAAHPTNVLVQARRHLRCLVGCLRLPPGCALVALSLAALAASCRRSLAPGSLATPAAEAHAPAHSPAHARMPTRHARAQRFMRDAWIACGSL